WAFPFPGSDASVVRRSQRYLHEELGESPVQYAAYATVPGFGSLLLTIVAGFFFGVLAKFRLGRSLLEKMKGTSFNMTLFAQGYSQGRDPQSEKPDVRMTTRVSGPEPGYVSTSMLLVQAGVTILKEHKALPKRGGVYTPAAAFGRTSLVERLCECGVAFSVVEEAGDKKSA
uniref:Saccharopine dehydrogenase-like C-terminal domain-containing protein n=1 Tax=Petromyzon marinus TaxID=7757 RepID=S4RN82_PETMA